MLGDAAPGVAASWRASLEAERRDHVPFRDWERAGFLQPVQLANIIDYTDVERAVYEAAEEFDLRCVGLDPALSRTLTSTADGPRITTQGSRSRRWSASTSPRASCT